MATDWLERALLGEKQACSFAQSAPSSFRWWDSLPSLGGPFSLVLGKKRRIRQVSIAGYASTRNEMQEQQRDGPLRDFEDQTESHDCLDLVGWHSRFLRQFQIGSVVP